MENELMVNESNLVDYIIQYEGGEITEEQVLHLFAYLIKTGQAWTLQGMYGRQAAGLIAGGYISKEGEIL